MKRNDYLMVLLMSAAVLILVAGCEKNPVEKSGDALINAYERSKRAGDAATLDAMNRSVQTYRASYGKNPGSIEELEHFMGSQVDHEKFEYDAETGAVGLRK
ncbi:MAG: hypothetical protein ACM34I_08925 [bacterium]